MEKNRSNRKDELKPVYLEEDEIDLWELWQTVKKRKYIILITTLIIFAIALLYAFTKKPVYEAKATIQIGKQIIKTGEGLQEKYFDDAKSLKHMLDVEYDTAGKYRNKNQTSYIDSIDIPRKTGGFLTITADAPSNKEAIKILKKPIDEIIAKHKAYFDSIIEIKRHEIDKLSKQLNYLKTIEYQQLKTALELVRSINQKKIDEKIRLTKSIDLKKIDESIAFIKNNKIPAIKKKIEESENDISKKEKMLANMKNRVSRAAEQSPALAAMAAMQMANLQNDIARLSKEIIGYQLEIKKLLDETIPNLEKEKKRIVEEVIPNLEKEKKRIVEEVIPAKKAAIKKLESITIPEISASIDDLKTSMKPPYIQMTQVVGKIYTHNYPVKPKKKLILAVALVTGLIMGIFLAFFVEFIGSKRREIYEK